MGYYTDFRLEIIEDGDYGVDFHEIIGEISDYGNIERDSIKWYNHVDDMIIMSDKYPKAVFALHGDGEDSDDKWIKYFKDGKMQIARAKITYEEFDESKLE